MVALRYTHNSHDMCSFTLLHHRVNEISVSSICPCTHVRVILKHKMIGYDESHKTIGDTYNFKYYKYIVLIVQISLE